MSEDLYMIRPASQHTFLLTFWFRDKIIGIPHLLQRESWVIKLFSRTKTKDQIYNWKTDDLKAYHPPTLSFKLKMKLCYDYDLVNSWKMIKMKYYHMSLWFENLILVPFMSEIIVSLLMVFSCVHCKFPEILEIAFSFTLHWFIF